MLGHDWLDETAEGTEYLKAVSMLHLRQILNIIPNMQKLVKEP